jgi:hypothetical protein
MKTQIKESHGITIICAIGFTLGALAFHYSIFDFDDLNYIKGKLSGIDYSKYRLDLVSENYTKITLKLDCKNSDSVIQSLRKGEVLEAWYQSSIGFIKPEIWALKNGNIELCAYKDKLNKLTMLRNIFLFLALVSWYFAVKQFQQRKVSKLDYKWF